MRSADEQRYFLSFASLMLRIYLIEIKKEEKTCSNIKEKKKLFSRKSKKMAGIFWNVCGKTGDQL